MALSYNAQFEIDLRAKVGELRTEKLNELEAGGAIKDYADYRERLGFLRGLKAASDACDEVHEDLQKR